MRRDIPPVELSTLLEYSYSVHMGHDISQNVKSILYNTSRELLPDASGAICSCEVCSIRPVGVCGALRGREIEKLNRIGHHRSFSSGQIILAEGAHAEFFGAIINGVVKLTKTLADGRQHIVGLLFPTDFLGRVFRAEHKYFAEAATDVELCCFPRQGFEKILSEHPALEDCLFRLALNELDACQEWMLLLGRKSAEERVASFLLMIARRVPEFATHSTEKTPLRFELPLARADIADCLGLTIETVSRQVTRLKSDHVIELVSNREILVPQIARLEDVANGRAHTGLG